MDAHWVNGRPGYRCRHGDELMVLCDPGEGAMVRAEDTEGPNQGDFVESLGSGLHPFMG